MMESETHESANRMSKFHFRVRVGVTGHRDVHSNERLAAQVRAVLDEITRLIDPSQAIPLQWEVVSCLADGADRIVAHGVLAKPDSRLRAVIPLTIPEYESTFGLDPSGAPMFANAVEQSRCEFYDLLNDVRTRPIYLRGTPVSADLGTSAVGRSTRHDAYRVAGEYVLRHCDFLIALYDPKRSRRYGGTQDILNHACRLGVPTYVIHVDKPDYRIDRYRLRRFDLSSYVAMKTFVKRYEQGGGGSSDSLDWSKPFDPTDAESLNEISRRQVEQYLAPAYTTASAVAKDNQRAYRATGISIYVLAMAAIVLVTLGAMVPKWGIGFFTLEAVALVGILVLVARSRRKGHHKQWILLRFLAERLRAASFLVAVGIQPSQLRQGPAPTGFEAKCDWTAHVFNRIVQLPPTPPSVPAELEAKRAFIAEVWVRSQQRWHLDRAGQRTVFDRRFESLGSTLFYATVLAALAHILECILWPDTHYLQRFAILAALAFPALGAAISWFRSHREYERLAARSEDMSDQLQTIAPIVETAGSDAFESVVRQVDEIMLTESQDWRGLVKFLNVKRPT